MAMLRKFSTLFCVLIALLLGKFQAHAQGTLTGHVQDSKTHVPLAGVAVLLQEDSTQLVISDTLGNFSMTHTAGHFHLISRYIGYKAILLPVLLSDLHTDTIQLKMEIDSRVIGKVQISGTTIKNTETAVIQEIKHQDNIVVGISSSQIAKTLDRDASQVVKRIPGVTIIQDKFINIRGLSERYNTVWINNAGVPSSETDRKSFSFDAIPSGMLDRILIFKTPSPELPGDFAGGMVKIFTKSIPDKNSITVSVSGSMRPGITGNTFYTGATSSTDWLGYDNTLRVLPAAVPTKVSAADNDYYNYPKTFSDPWTLNTQKARGDYRANLSLTNVIKLNRTAKIGNTLGLFYSNTQTNNSITRQDWDSTSRTYIYLDQQSVAQVRCGWLENMSFVNHNFSLEATALLNQNGTNKTTFRTNEGLDTTRDNERTYVFEYQSRETFAFQLNGNVHSNSKNTSYSVTAAYNYSNNFMPDLRRITYTKDIHASDSLYYAGIPAGTADPNEGGRFFSSLQEKMKVLGQQFKQKIVIHKYSFDVSAGTYFEDKHRDFSARQFGYVIRPGIKAFYFKYLPVNQIFSDTTVGGKDLFNIDEITDNTYAYSADNKLRAAYVMLNIPVGKKIKISGGARYEYNVQSLTGYNSLADTVPIHPSDTTHYLLPSVNLSYNLNKHSLLRLAYGQTLNRPEFREWAPFYFYDFEFTALTYGSLYSSIVNGVNGRILKTCNIHNYDVRYEWYPSNSESLQLGAFYKTFDSPIQSIADFSTGNRTFTFVNAKNATVYGAEADVRKNAAILDTLLHTHCFRNFSLVMNASLIKSLATFDTATVKSQMANSPLQGQSPYVFNAGVYYQNDSLGLQITVLYNVVGPRILFIGTSSDKSRVNPNIGEMPQGMLDITLSKTFLHHFQGTLGVQNLLNSKVQWLEDTNVNGKFERNSDKEMLSYKQGMYLTAGLKVLF